MTSAHFKDLRSPRRTEPGQIDSGIALATGLLVGLGIFTSYSATAALALDSLFPPLFFDHLTGLVLGGLVETSLAQSMIIFDQQWTGFLARPIALTFFALALISMLNAPVRGFIKNRSRRSGGAA